MFFAAFNVGSYTVGLRMLVTIRFHLLPQKSWSDVERIGLLNCGSNSKPNIVLANVATIAKIISNRKYMWKQYIPSIIFG